MAKLLLEVVKQGRRYARRINEPLTKYGIRGSLSNSLISVKSGQIRRDHYGSVNGLNALGSL